MAVTHAKVSNITDSADTTVVRPSDWNANHIVSGYVVNTDGRLADVREPTSHNSSYHTVNYAPLAANMFVPQVNLGSGVYNAITYLRGDNQWYTPSGGGYTQGASVYHNANQSTNNVTTTTLAMNSERWDTDNCHDNTTNNSRLTCKTAGKYLIVGGIRWAANATGYRVSIIKLNGITEIGENRFMAVTTGGSCTSCRTAAIRDLAINDYVELIAFQNSGGALNCEYDPQNSCEFAMMRIG